MKQALRLKPVLAVLMAQQERLDRQEELLQSMALLLDHLGDQPPPERLSPQLQVLTVNQVEQRALLLDLQGMVLELLQATQPPADQQLSQLIGLPSPPS